MTSCVRKHLHFGRSTILDNKTALARFGNIFQKKIETFPKRFGIFPKGLESRKISNI